MTASQSSFMGGTVCRSTHGVTRCTQRESKVTRTIDGRRLAVGRGRRRQDIAPVELVLFDALDQQADVLTRGRLVDLLAELLDGVHLDARPAVDAHDVTDLQRAGFHPAGRDDAAIADDEDVLDGHPEHQFSLIKKTYQRP